jgi:hypothetical protein
MMKPAIDLTQGGSTSLLAQLLDFPGKILHLGSRDKGTLHRMMGIERQFPDSLSELLRFNFINSDTFMVGPAPEAYCSIDGPTFLKWAMPCF